MNLDHDFVQVSKLGEDQKKRSSPKMEHFFSPNSSRHRHSDAHQSQIIEGDTDVDHTQTIGVVMYMACSVHKGHVTAP